MIVSDFDNTLINWHNSFDNYQVKILKRLKKSDIVFSLVTGRNVSFFNLFPELLEVVDYIISANGASIYDVKNKKFLYNICIADETVGKLINLGIENNYTFIINEFDKIYKYGNLKKIDSIDFELNRHYLCQQIVFYIENIDIDKFIETKLELYNVSVNNINKKDNIYSIDINERNVSKGSGVLWLCDYLKIDTEEVIAFGDGENDISMFKVVKKGICVDNACSNLKRYATEIVGSCNECGVFKYIENNILNINNNYEK